MHRPLNKRIFAGFIVAAMAVLVMAFSQTPTTKPDASPPAAAPAADKAPAASADDQTMDGYSDILLGDPKAPIKVIEYASMTCPHCAAFNKDVFHEFKKKWVDTGKANYVLRNFVLNGPDLVASMIARCVDRSQYYAYADLFLSRQAEWIPPWQNIKPEKDSTLAELADEAEMDKFLRPTGLSKEHMNKCLLSGKLRDDLLKQRVEGTKKFDIKGTPTIIVNGETYTGPHTYEDFDKALKEVK